jgi:tetratricopeptide (TPR) repeat protein
MPSPSTPHRYRDWWMAAVLAAVAVAVFARVLWYGFITFDDPYYVFLNRHVLTGLNPHSIAWAFTTFDNSNWHPLTWLSLELDTTLWGQVTWGYHLTNVLLHAANTTLIFLTLRALTGACWRSAAVALLFAVHPLRVESVAWVTERKDVLSTFFGLVALRAYVHYAAAPSARRYVAVALALALSLLAKSMLVTLPFLLLVLDWWPLRRVDGSPAPSIAGIGEPVDAGGPVRPAARGWPHLIAEKVPLFALVAASAAVTYYVQSAQGSVMGLTKFPLSARLGNVALSYVAYLSKTFWPTGLAVFYPHPGACMAAWKVVGAVLILTAVTAAAVALRRRVPYLLAGWLWYVGTLIPVIGLVQVGNQAYADRYTYFPQIGILLALCWGVTELSMRHARVALAALAAAAAALVFVTERQLEFWRDSVILWEHTILAAGESPTSLMSLARALEDVGGPEAMERARRHYEEALALDPDSALGQSNLGGVLTRIGRQDEAVEHLTRACELDPKFAIAHINLGDAYFKQGKLDAAAREQLTALALAPGNYTVYLGLGRTEFARGNVEGAIKRYQEALRLWPDYPDANYQLAAALLKQGDRQDAIAYLQRAVIGNPRLGEAHFLLGKELLAEGQTAPGFSHLAKAVFCGPMPWDAYFLLGRELAKRGDLEHAEAHLSRAVQLNPQAAEAWDCLGMTRVGLGYPDRGQACVETALKLDPHSVAYQSDLARILDAQAAGMAEEGNLSKAVATDERALELAKAAKNAALIALIEKQLDGFQHGKTGPAATRPAP